MSRLWLAALLLAACGGGGFDAPTCANGEVTIRLDVDGEITEDSRSGFASYGFINALGDADGTLDITFTDGGELHLQFEELVANGDSVPARGQVVFGGELDVGNCETGPFSGTLAMDEDGDGGTFQLVDLHTAPPCTGLALTGTITGCFRQDPL